MSWNIYDATSGGGSDPTRALKDGSNITNASTWRTNLSVPSMVECMQRSQPQLGGVAFDGYTPGVIIAAPLTGQTVGTADVSLWARVLVPSSLGGSNRQIMALSPSASDSAEARALRLIILSTGELYVSLFGATTSDYVAVLYSGFQSAYAGKITDITFTRTGSTVALYVNGSAVTTSAQSGGSVPAWSDTVTASYLLLGSNGSSSYLWNSVIYRAAVFNRALSATDAQNLATYGIDAADEWGSSAALVTGADSDFSADSGFWTKTNTTISGGVATLGATTGVISRAAGLTRGRRYRCAFTTGSNSGSVSLSDGTTTIISGITTNTTTTVEFVSTGTALTISNTGAGTVTIDNVTLVAIGAVVDLDLSVGIGLWYPDRSSNNLCADGTSGVTNTIPLKGGVYSVSKYYVHSDISTIAAVTKMFDLPPNCGVVRVEWDRTVAMDAAITLNLGIAGNSSLFVSGAAASSSGILSVASAQLASQSNNLATAVYLKKSAVTTVGAVIVRVVVEVRG